MGSITAFVSDRIYRFGSSAFDTYNPGKHRILLPAVIPEAPFYVDFAILSHNCREVNSTLPINAITSLIEHQCRIWLLVRKKKRKFYFSYQNN
jgi:hypothetical protein